MIFLLPSLEACPELVEGGAAKELFYPLLGGVPRSGGVGFFVAIRSEPTPACGHPSREGSCFIPFWELRGVGKRAEP